MTPFFERSLDQLALRTKFLVCANLSLRYAQTLDQLGQAIALPQWTLPPNSYYELRQRLAQIA
jgi:hypothetical protein